MPTVQASNDRLKAALARVIQSLVGARLDFLAYYPGVATNQNGDGTLDILPDDPRIPSVQGVPIRYGVPGVTATITNGARVLLGWAAGDPSKPIATVWEGSGSVLTSLTIGPADTVLVRYSDLKALLDAQTHIGNLGFPTGAPIVAVPATVGSSVIHVK